MQRHFANLVALIFFYRKRPDFFVGPVVIQHGFRLYTLDLDISLTRVQREAVCYVWGLAISIEREDSLF